jgi:TonB family protein
MQGDLYLSRDGQVRRFAFSHVRLVPAAALQAAAALCTAHDSAMERHQHLSRDARVAADLAARGPRERREYWRAVADSLAAGVSEASARRAEAEGAVVRLLNAQPETRTDSTAHYSIGDVVPGPYLLYAIPDVRYYWLEPVEVKPTPMTVDLNNRNVSTAWVTLHGAIAGEACAYSRNPKVETELPGALTEAPPALLNASEVQRQLSRRYPGDLRDAGVTGEAVLRFRIRADGTVDPYSIEIASATLAPFGDQAALVAETMRFRPAELDGRPVAVWALLPIGFRLQR